MEMRDELKQTIAAAAAMIEKALTPGEQTMLAEQITAFLHGMIEAVPPEYIAGIIVQHSDVLHAIAAIVEQVDPEKEPIQ